jgi:hypothetical protein
MQNDVLSVQRIAEENQELLSLLAGALRIASLSPASGPL